jgi:hypothetical protein
MEKIPTALVRDPNNRAKVLHEITPGCEWVFAGEGVPTRKWDGTCVMLDESGSWWARREVKFAKPTPPNFVAVTHDAVTGKTQGWEPIEQSSFAKFHQEALEFATVNFEAGTYELIGPKLNGNPEHVEVHYLLKHSYAPTVAQLILPLTVESVCSALKRYCEKYGAEGVVWHHPDGRMAKLKGKDL